MKLKLIKKGRRGNGNEYSFGQIIFRIVRYQGFYVYDLAKGTHENSDVFHIYGRGVEFYYGLRSFKHWLSTSEYVKKGK